MKRGTYHTVTSFWEVLLIILAPCNIIRLVTDIQLQQWTLFLTQVIFTWYHILKSESSLTTITLSDWKFISNSFSASYLTYTVQYKDTRCIFKHF